MKDSLGFSLLLIAAVLGSFYTGWIMNRSEAMRQVERTVQMSVQTGKPFMFESGRMGLIEEVHHAKNGRTIAYRVISFTLPEEK